jgi:hypothetical protein
MASAIQQMLMGSGAVTRDNTNALILLDFDDPTNVIDYGTAGTGNWTQTNSPLSTTSPKFGAGCLDGHTANGFVSRSSYTGIESVGTGNFTVDFWVKFQNMGNWGLWAYGDGAGRDNGDIDMQWDNNNTRWTFSSKNAGASADITGTDTVTTGVWYHIAVVRSATNTLTIYRDGVSKGSGTCSANLGNQGFPKNFWVGQDNMTGQFLDGFIDEFRFSNTARWTSNFTPPTAAY